MAGESGNKITFKKTPYGFWLFAVGMIIVGSFFIYLWLLDASNIIYIALGLILAGLAIILLARATTITIDKEVGKLSVRRKGLLRKSFLEYPLSDIATIKVEQDIQEADDDEPGFKIRNVKDRRVYRVSIFMESGEVIPLDNYTSKGSYFTHSQEAKELRDFLGIEDPSAGPASMSEAVSMAWGGEFSFFQEDITAGVSWRVETGTFFDRPVTRWHAPGYKYSGHFLYLVQKLKDKKGGRKRSAGLLGSLSRTITRQVMKMWGFEPEDTPGLETAESLDDIDQRLATYYSSLASDPFGARRLLTPPLVTPLVEWAERYPMRRVATGKPPNEFNQIAVLFCPQGLYVAYFNIANPDRIESITALGLELVRAVEPERSYG